MEGSGQLQCEQEGLSRLEITLYHVTYPSNGYALQRQENASNANKRGKLSISLAVYLTAFTQNSLLLWCFTSGIKLQTPAANVMHNAAYGSA